MGAHAARSCEDWAAELTAVEGTVEIQRSGTAIWSPAVSGALVCSGDAVRVQASGRAAITLPDQSTLRLGEHTTLALPEPASGVGSLIELLRGVIHVISRDPRALQFNTPYANAGLEGTEFDIRVEDGEPRTEVAVLEGEVVVTTPGGKINAPSGYLAQARPNEPPVRTRLAQPIELMRWAGYYPPLIDQVLPEPDQQPDAAHARDSEFYARRAAARLLTARIDDASADLNTSLRIAPANSTALALQAMLALGRGDHAEARRLATAAADSTPMSVPSLIALSHVQQRAAELAAADRSVRQALVLEPTNAIAVARLAEVELARGDTDASLSDARRAAELAPKRADPLTVQGFAHLAALDVAAARAAFERAAVLEPAAPMPRLGLALALAQQGDLLGGRRQLETAVALDPTDPLLRSYMARLYGAEHRDPLTRSQLDLAKDFDPTDPTPWLWAALQSQQDNRPLDALREYRTATHKNDNRAAFRSRFALDKDLATRSAGLGRLHTEPGYGRLALLDAWRAVTDDPAEYAGHRLLADVYATIPGQEIARVSELFVSQLLQPINVTPIKAQLAHPGTLVATRLGPSQLSFNEFSSPVTTNGLVFQASSVVGGNGIAGDDLSLSGLHDRVSYSVSQYRFATDGFRDNNDLDERFANAFFQAQPNADTGLQVELRATRTEHGDIAFKFDPELYDALLRADESTDSIRFGVRRDLSRQDTLLASVIYQEADAGLVSGPASYDTQQGGYSVDVQLMHVGDKLRVQSGAVVARQNAYETARLEIPGLPLFTQIFDGDKRQAALYSYVHWAASPSLTLTAGVGLDQLHDQYVDEDAANPKLGLLWRPTPRTTVRAAAFRSLFGSLTTSRQNAQPRLEPVQLAGFSQLVFGGTADRSTVRGIGVDHELSERLFVGWEASQRDTDRQVLLPFNPPELAVQSVALTERSQRAYLYWMPHDRLSFSTQYERGRYGNAPIDVFGYSEMRLRRLPIELRYFGTSGLTAGIRASDLVQDGLFTSAMMPPAATSPMAASGDRFWVVDASIGYRLPRRRGFLSLNADNLFDERFRFQDIDPEDMSVIHERVVSFRFTLSFD